MKQECPICGRRVDVSGIGIPNVTPWLREHLIGKARALIRRESSRKKCEGSFLSTGAAAYELAARKAYRIVRNRPLEMRFGRAALCVGGWCPASSRVVPC